MFGVMMMLGSEGNVYTFSQISGWLAEAGFKSAEIHPALAHISVIIASRSPR
jgi:hypothetical protein